MAQNSVFQVTINGLKTVGLATSFALLLDLLLPCNFYTSILSLIQLGCELNRTISGFLWNTCTDGLSLLTAGVGKIYLKKSTEHLPLFSVLLILFWVRIHVVRHYGLLTVTRSAPLFLTYLLLIAVVCYQYGLNETLAKSTVWKNTSQIFPKSILLLLEIFAFYFFNLICSCFAVLLFLLLQFIKCIPSDFFLSVVLILWKTFTSVGLYSGLSWTPLKIILSPLTKLFKKPNNLNATYDNGQLCVICCDSPKCIVLLPCRHMCLCEPCTRLVFQNDMRCPLCRKVINSKIHVYS